METEKDKEETTTKNQGQKGQTNPPAPEGARGRTQPQKDKDMAEPRLEAVQYGPPSPKQAEQSEKKSEDTQRDQDQSSRRFDQRPQDLGTNVR